jgi:hypothetical protein
MMVKRYRFVGEYRPLEAPEGLWVSWADHQAEVERLRERNEKLLDLIGPSLPAIVDAYERWLIEQGE